MPFKRTIKDISVRDKVCLMRVDFNVKLDDNGKIVDDKRIRETLPTLYNLIGRGAKIVLISHLGRPKGKTDDTSMRPVANHLVKSLLQEYIQLADLDDRETTKSMVATLQSGQVMMLENIRRYAGEKEDPIGFGKQLASLGDLYINDGFGVSHREHASVVGIAQHLPAVAGMLLEQEIKYMQLTINKKQARPFVAVVGGKKSEEKITVIKALLRKVDDVLLGGGIVNTFLKAGGFEVGKSFHEPEKVPEAQEIMRSAMQKSCGLVIPPDLVVTKEINETANFRSVDYQELEQDDIAVDIGPKAREKYRKILEKAGFTLWIGPMGVYEIKNFRAGNDAILDAIIASDASSFLGGGDTIASISEHPGKDFVSHISTGGGATLKYLEQGTLVGIDALDERNGKHE